MTKNYAACTISLHFCHSLKTGIIIVEGKLIEEILTLHGRYHISPSHLAQTQNKITRPSFYLFQDVEAFLYRIAYINIRVLLYKSKKASCKSRLSKSKYILCLSYLSHCVFSSSLHDKEPFVCLSLSPFSLYTDTQ